jgi:DNA glycosylase AlkZ-like
MNLNDIAIERLYSQHIEGQEIELPADLVSGMGAIQGQDYAGAKWSIGLRLPGISDDDVEQALRDKYIVRTWALRGTLHLVASSDIRWIISLLAPRIILKNSRRYKELKLDDETFSKSNRLLKKALDNNKLTRSELLNILESKSISTTGQRAAYILQRASLDGLICQSITRHNNPTYISMDELPKSRKLKRNDALAELAKRYFNGHGPGTLKDFVWWSGLLVKDAKDGLEAIKYNLHSEVVKGETYWMSPISDKNPESPTVNLLPGFDEYLLGYRDRSASIDSDQSKNLLIHANGFFRSTIVVNGKVVGTWKRTIKKNTVSISINNFRRLSSVENEALVSEMNKYGEFLGKSVERG